MKTFFVQTLGCKVNHYESEQIASLLRARGLVESDPSSADLRVVNTCSVTVEAAGKSRQTTRRLVRLPLLEPRTSCAAKPATPAEAPHTIHSSCSGTSRSPDAPASAPSDSSQGRPRVIVMGCWATSDPSSAAAVPGVDAVLTHHGDVAADLDRFLLAWGNEDYADATATTFAALGDLEGHPGPTPSDRPNAHTVESPPEPCGNEGWMIGAGSPAGIRTDARTQTSKADSIGKVNAELDAPVPLDSPPRAALRVGAGGAAPAWAGTGTTRLPLLGQRQPGRQRAVLKVQDGCDAHCTYCIIPRLRPIPWSKPVDDVVEEARRLVDAGHVEIVLTGIFLGAYGQTTALRRRQTRSAAGPLGELVAALCTRVPRLRRLRLSSLEPGDLTDGLLCVLRSHAQVVPHFHLPLQSGSDTLLRRMNRQYGRDDFLRMVDTVRAAFDRPALTTDIIAGFPGETDEEFDRTLEVVDHAGFIHIHAFPCSPRPGTAAARWEDLFVPGAVAKGRIELLRRRADEHSLSFRRRFVGEVVELLVEEGDGGRHGRCERYFDVHFDDPATGPGDFLRVRIDEVTTRRTYGTRVGRGWGHAAGGPA